MNDDIDFSRFLIVGLVLLLMAFGGWGAFAYALGSAQLRDRALQREIALVAAERKTLAEELDRVREDADRKRQALEQAHRNLAIAQQQAATPSDQAKGREPVSSGLASSRAAAALPQQIRPGSGSVSR
jgi:hypothetical protein